MTSAKETIISILSNVVEKVTGEKEEIRLDVPEDSKNGNYSASIALKLSKKLGKSPREIAESLKTEIENNKPEIVEKIEVAGPGFLNFYMSSTYLTSNLTAILEKKDTYGYSNHLENKKVMVEFTDPNPLKEFHIGHVYTNTVGESISRLFESQGADVWRVNYQGDVGLHVAKALWGILHQEEKFEEYEGKTLSERAKFLGKSYALGSKAFEEDETSKQEIITLNKKVYDHDSEIYPFYEKAKSWSLEYFETLYQRLGTKFKRYYFESEVAPVGLEIIKAHMGDVFIEDQGAIVFPKEKSGLHTRVFVNSLGIPTYEGKELGLPSLKYADFPYDRSIIITGQEINEYFKVLLKALSLIDPELASKTHHIGHGMVRLTTGKMSSRTGNVITGEWLLEEAQKKLEEAHPDMGEGVAERISVGAIKYAFLKSGIGQDLSFSIEESISLHGNSGPYLQYAYARTQSILGKAQISDTTLHVSDMTLEPEELDLLRSLAQFTEVVSRAQTEFTPGYICTYLFDLTQKFSLFYEKHRVIGDKKEVQDFRLMLVSGVGQVLKNGLYFLGISAPEKI